MIGGWLAHKVLSWDAWGVYLAGASFFYSALAYNRDGFGNNTQMRQNQMYQEKNYNIAWIAAVREEVRDLMSIFVGRMSNYMVVNTLIAGVAGGTICEGEVSERCPNFIAYAFYMSFVIAVVYLVKSMMLATKGITVAYVSSLQFLVEVVPDEPDFYNFDYRHQLTTEFERDPKEVFRVPSLPWRGLLGSAVRRAELENLPRGGRRDAPHPRRRSETKTSVPPVTSAPQDDIEEAQPVSYFASLRLYSQLWEPFATSAAVCMSHGLTSIFHGAAYFMLGKLYDREARWVSLSFLAVFVVAALLLSGDGLMTTDGGAQREDEAQVLSTRRGSSSSSSSSNKPEHSCAEKLALPLVFTGPVLLAIADRTQSGLIHTIFVCSGFPCHALFHALCLRHSMQVSDSLRELDAEMKRHEQIREAGQREQGASPASGSVGCPPRCDALARRAQRQTSTAATNQSQGDETREATPRREDPQYRLSSLLVKSKNDISLREKQSRQIMVIAHLMALLGWLSLSVWSLLEHVPLKDITANEARIEWYFVKAWPNQPFFRPSYMACTSSRAFLADDFAVYEFASGDFRQVRCEVPGPITSIAAACDGNRCSPLVLTRGSTTTAYNCSSGRAVSFAQPFRSWEQILALDMSKVFSLNGSNLIQYAWNPARTHYEPLWYAAQNIDREHAMIVDVAVGGDKKEHFYAFSKTSFGKVAIQARRLSPMLMDERRWVLPVEAEKVKSACVVNADSAMLVVKQDNDDLSIIRARLQG